MSIYVFDLEVEVNGSDSKIPVHYTMPYMPVNEDWGNTWDEHNQVHVEYIGFCKKIYNSKYRNTMAWYYLFSQDLNTSLTYFTRNNIVTTVIPIPSSHPLAGHFAVNLAERYRVPVVECMEKVEKSVFTPKDVILPHGKVLVVDDVVTQGRAIKASIECLVNDFGKPLNDIVVLCIAKTERDFITWDEEKSST